MRARVSKPAQAVDAVNITGGADADMCIQWTLAQADIEILLIKVFFVTLKKFCKFPILAQCPLQHFCSSFAAIIKPNNIKFATL